jgi:type II secretory ATPase GspE/PulE/Tfp pilus assembly ATPase PilB-like protein
MVLVTGPTGSGKTVSLYTCLNILNQPGVNISTAEDPAEIQLPGINQVNVNDKAGLTFAAALRAFLRQDPDIIMVGEIRDLETADIAIKAAQTGHMVLSTLHTNDAPARWYAWNMGVAPFNIASSVILITAQRLARKLCSCKQPADCRRKALLSAGFRGRTGRQLGSLQGGRLRALQGQRLQGAGGHLPGHADHRVNAGHDPEAGHRARHRPRGTAQRRARSASIGLAQGQKRHHVAGRSAGLYQRIGPRLGT